jgi:hypothetical protein
MKNILIAAVLLFAACAVDDPIPGPVISDRLPVTTTTSVSAMELVRAPSWEVHYLPQEVYYLPQAMNILQPEDGVADVLTADFEWMRASDETLELQQLIGVEADGVYGPRTRRAHLVMLEVFKLPVSGVPDKPAAGSIVPDPVSDGPFWDNVERWRPIVTEAVFAWGGDEADVHRFLRIMQCESAGIPTAKNPTSSASGLMQQLARYWPQRASKAGMPGADVFDPYANVWVSAYLALAMPGGGWGHWVCQ